MITILIMNIKWFTIKLKWVKDRLTTLPNDIFLDLSKLKAFADNNINVTQKKTVVFARIENIVGKGENAGYQHFPLFPKCFQKLSFFGSLKVGIVWKRIKTCKNVSLNMGSSVPCPVPCVGGY